MTNPTAPTASVTPDELFAGVPVMAILRGLGAERSIELSTVAWDLGIDAVELPIQSDEDVAALRAVAAVAQARGKVVGAGTIVSEDQIDVAIAAGAQFLVSPGIDADLVRAAQRRGIAIIPGVATPSDVQLGVSLGLTWLKAFPATWLGSDWFAHMRGPFPQVRFVATGGMNAHNAAEYLAAGVRVVAVGAALEDPSQLEKLAELLRG